MRLDGTRPDRFEMIANRMMKSLTGRGYHGVRRRKNNVAGDREEIEEFKRVYHDTISYLDSTFTRNVPIPLSVGVIGALGKAILWYGKAKMQPFVEAIAKREFKGRADPCFALWEWIIRRNNKRNDANECYAKTISAIRAFIKGNECKDVRSATEDIFEWDGDFRHMCQYKRRNQNTKESIKSVCRQPDEAVAADIEECLSACPT
jgi:hypothetical protein